MLDVAREKSWTCLTYYYRLMVSYLKKKKEEEENKTVLVTSDGTFTLIYII